MTGWCTWIGRAVVFEFERVAPDDRYDVLAAMAIGCALGSGELAAACGMGVAFATAVGAMPSTAARLSGRCAGGGVAGNAGIGLSLSMGVDDVDVRGDVLVAAVGTGRGAGTWAGVGVEARWVAPREMTGDVGVQAGETLDACELLTTGPIHTRSHVSSTCSSWPASPCTWGVPEVAMYWELLRKGCTGVPAVPPSAVVSSDVCRGFGKTAAAMGPAVSARGGR